MNYFQARSDLEFIVEFREDMGTLLTREGQVGKEHRKRLYSVHPGVTRKRQVQAYAAKDPSYLALRQKVCKGVRRATKLALNNDVPISGQSVPSPEVGGALIPFSLFDAALSDYTYSGVDNMAILDALDQTVGACEECVKTELRHLANPLYWLRELLFFVLRVPFILVQATGFDTEKIEDHLFGKLFKVVEVMLIGYVLMRLGATKTDLIEILKGLFN